MAVTIVNDEEFLKELETHDRVAVKFFTEWCGSCRLFRPKFIRMSEDERFKGIRFLDIDAEKNPLARKSAKITHYPAFVIYWKGSIVDSLATTKSELIEEMLTKVKEMD